MRIDRRGFMHVLAATTAWLAGGNARAAEPVWTCEIHQQTRNTRLGPRIDAVSAALERPGPFASAAIAIC